MRKLCRAVRPLAAGEPVVTCRQFMPTVSRAARPLANSRLSEACEAGYAMAFGAKRICASTTRMKRGGVKVSVASKTQCAHEQAPNPSVERTANGVCRSFAWGDAVPPLASAHVKRWASPLHLPLAIESQN